MHLEYSGGQPGAVLRDIELGRVGPAAYQLPLHQSAAKGMQGTPTKCQVSKRQVSKRQVSKRQVSKRPVSKRPKRQVYKTSGLQNVRFTKRQVYKNVRLQNVWFQNVLTSKYFKALHNSRFTRVLQRE
jgi:hypothetical protein